MVAYAQVRSVEMVVAGGGLCADEDGGGREMVGEGGGLTERFPSHTAT